MLVFGVKNPNIIINKLQTTLNLTFALGTLSNPSLFI